MRSDKKSCHVRFSFGPVKLSLCGRSACQQTHEGQRSFHLYKQLPSARGEAHGADCGGSLRPAQRWRGPEVST